MLALLAGFCSLGSAPPFHSETVSMTCRGVPVGEVVRRVADQTGLAIKVGNVAGDPVIVKVDEMPTKPFLESLAHVLGDLPAGFRQSAEKSAKDDEGGG